jgi:putative ABC transport system permease protein
VLRLVFADLWDNTRVWVGALVVVTIAALLVALAFSQTETASQLKGAAGQTVRNFSAPSTVLTTISALIVLIPVIDLVVRIGQRKYALWQLVGVLPGTIRAVVLVQVAVVAVAGSCIGVLVAWPLAQPVLDFVVDANTSLSPIPVRYGPGAIVGTFITIVITTALAGLKGAFSAADTPALEAMRTPVLKNASMGIARWIVCGILLVAAVLLALAISKPSDQHRDQAVVAVTGLAMFLCIVLTAAAASLGPLLFPVVLNLWTRLVPARLSTGWYLARNASRYRLTQTGAAITPLVVAASLASGIYTVFLTAGTAINGGNGAPINGTAIFTIIGAPLLISGVGVGVVVIVTSGARAREYSQLLAAGASGKVLVIAAGCEAIIYVATAAIISLGIVAVLAFLLTLGLSNKASNVHAVIGVDGGVIALALGLVLLGAAMVPQAAAAVSRTVTSSRFSDDG